MKKIFLLVCLSMSLSSIMANTPGERNQRSTTRSVTTTVTTTQVESTKEPQKPEHNAKEPAPEHKAPVASQEMVTKIVNVMNNSSFDDNKVQIAKLCVELCPISVNGLSQMAKTISFDDKRLEFLKYAYKYCPDTENYLKLRDALSFDSAKNKLVDFIAQQK